MSRPEQTVKIDSRTVRPSQTLSPGLQQIIQQIDTRLQDLTAHAIVQPPYLLSVPSEYPYRYSSRFVNSWYVGTPFLQDEEELQYLSFLPHQNHDEELLKVLGSWADEHGNLVEETSPIPMVTTVPSTPLQQPNRKKISLKDYKNKDKLQDNAPEPDSIPKDMKTDVKGLGLKNAGVMKQNGEAVQQSPKPAKSDKRPTVTTHVDKIKVEIDSTRARSDDLPSPRKRRKLDLEGASPPAEHAHSHQTIKLIPKEKLLPPILSPTLPASESAKSQKALPVLLLPDLPPALVKEIAKAEANSDSDNQTLHQPDAKSKDRHLSDDAKLEKKQAGPAPKSDNHKRQESLSSIKDLAPDIKTASPRLQPHVKLESGIATPVRNGIQPSSGPRQRRIIVLKYGKKNRKRVEALLKFASRPKKTIPVADDMFRKHVETSLASKRPVLEDSHSEKKRVVEASPERPVKKQKTSALLQTPERTRTPAHIVDNSPASALATTKVKQELATPRLEPKSIAMQRVASSDDFDVRTPPISQAITSTPVRNTGLNHLRASPLPTSNSVSRDDRIAWDDLKKKYHALGRTLKRESTSLSEKKTEHDQTLSIILSIEAMLCFMVNLAAQTHVHPGTDPGWATMLPYHNQVSRASRKYRHLHGLVIQLGAICRQIYHDHNIDRLAKEPIPTANSDDVFGTGASSAPTPGSDGLAKSSSHEDQQPEKAKRRAYIEFRDNLVQNSRELQSAWLEGSRFLSPYLLEREYPKTWSRRAKDTSRRGATITSTAAAISGSGGGGGNINPASAKTATSIVIGKEFWLPLDPNTTAFEGMRFCLSFLEEWSGKEKISWKTKIDL